MYSAIIGLEIHAELKTKSKMFCACKNDPRETTPNTNVCPVCLAHPGVLPVINEEAVLKVIKTGLSLSCQILEESKFDRKNYFYPDLPKGYQISQYDKPLCENGILEILSGGDKKKIRIRRVHLEEDTGRLLHPEGKDYSLVDFNRAGVPLMELVTEPDIRTAEEAVNFAKELQLILRYLDVSEADMEKGQMRVEVNISLTEDVNKFGTKVEVKNLNSFKAVEGAINHEIKRQIEALESSEKIVQETRGWNDLKEATVSQRVKEEAHDYRYFPEPDLPPMHFSKKQIEEIKARIPELPQERRERLVREYEIPGSVSDAFTQNKDLGEYFEQTVSEFDPNLSKENLAKLIKTDINYLTSDLVGLMQKNSVDFANLKITPENFSEFIGLIQSGTISSAIAKAVLSKMFEAGKDPSQIIEEENLSLVTNEDEILRFGQEVIGANPKAVEDYQKGKANAVQFLVGQLMAKTKGKASPQIAQEIILRLLTR